MRMDALRRLLPHSLDGRSARLIPSMRPFVNQGQKVEEATMGDYQPLAGAIGQAKNYGLMASLHGVPRVATQSEQLQAKKQWLEDELQRVNAALEALKANPEIERVINLVQQAL